MNNNPLIQILSLLRKYSGRAILTGLLVAAAAFVFLVTTQKAFQGSTDLLVSQNDQAGSQDFYTLSRSAEYTSKILSEVMFSEAFVNAVVETGIVNKEFLPFDQKERLKAWSKMVQVDKNLELGILRIHVLESNQRNVTKISQAIIQVLTENRGAVLGDNAKNITVKVLSGPIIESNPSIKEIALVVFAGCIFGILLYVVAKFIREELE